MLFLVDENLPRDLCTAAEAFGHRAVWVRDLSPGESDSVLVDRLMTSGETLVTRDVRFANLIVSLVATGAALEGVVLIREERVSEMRSAWAGYLSQDVGPAGVVVLSGGAMRVRRLGTSQQ